MASLRVFVCLLGLVVLCHSQCTTRELVVKDPNNPPKGCVDDDGQQHEFDSTWEKDCMECSCSTNGMSCCSKVPEPNTVEIPEECELIVDKKACSAKMVLKSDKTKECSPT
ncbi:beta-microseminoprotein [Sphaeramia orbicularis]|uniref:Beta-microseminoprotein n=1 Tax=Sphaeramia orbicularis TaxID=375764 RepID=A0A673B6V1_9TELE|nr:beta-microseminoprotein [Sphaeramia orbicularis]